MTRMARELSAEVARRLMMRGYECIHLRRLDRREGAGEDELRPVVKPEEGRKRSLWAAAQTGLDWVLAVEVSQRGGDDVLFAGRLSSSSLSSLKLFRLRWR